MNNVYGESDTLLTEEGFGGAVALLVGYAFIILGSIFWPYPINLIPIGYAVCALATVLLRIRLSIKVDKDTSFSRELFFGINTPNDNIPASILLWPAEYLHFFLYFACHAGTLSYRDAFCHAEFDRIFKTKRGIHQDTAYDSAKYEQNKLDKASDVIGEKASGLAQNLQNVPAHACQTAVIVTACTMASPAKAQNIIPDISIGNEAKLQSYGWIWNTVRDDLTTEKKETEFDWAMLRFRSMLTTKTPFGAFTELELAHADERKTNWLRQLYLSYKPNEAWELRLGRLFLAPGYVTPRHFCLRPLAIPAYRTRYSAMACKPRENSMA